MLADSKAPVARAGVGVVVRKGAPKPDISTPEKFKQALLDAKTVAYTNPASGGQSGVYFAKLLDQLGITDEINKKAKFGDGGPVALIVAKGDAEMGHAADPRAAGAFRRDRFRRPAAGGAAIVQSPDRRHSRRTASSRRRRARSSSFSQRRPRRPIMKAKGLEPG